LKIWHQISFHASIPNALVALPASGSILIIGRVDKGGTGSTTPPRDFAIEITTPDRMIVRDDVESVA
jgi:hypothetical protein